jgi:ribonuclease BN (tRNA processing enzyme)
MELVVLGCSGSTPGPDSPASGYLVRTADGAVALDLGNGTLGPLQRELDLPALDAVLLSHLHPDHCADLTALAVHRRYGPGGVALPGAGAVAPLPVYAPDGVAGRVAAAYAPNERERAETDLSDVFGWRHWDPARPVEVAGLRVRVAPADHLCPAFAIRLESGGRSLVYTGDTGPCAAVTELARGADLLLAEASWTDAPDRPSGVHLSGRQAGRMAADAGVGLLVVTHVPPWTDRDAVLAEATDAFGGPVRRAEPGLRLPV